MRTLVLLVLSACCFYPPAAAQEPAEEQEPEAIEELQPAPAEDQEIDAPPEVQPEPLEQPDTPGTEPRIHGRPRSPAVADPGKPPKYVSRPSRDITNLAPERCRAYPSDLEKYRTYQSEKQLWNLLKIASLGGAYGIPACRESKEAFDRAAELSAGSAEPAFEKAQRAAFEKSEACRKALDGLYAKECPVQPADAECKQAWRDMKFADYLDDENQKFRKELASREEERLDLSLCGRDNNQAAGPTSRRGRDKGQRERLDQNEAPADRHTDPRAGKDGSRRPPQRGPRGQEPASSKGPPGARKPASGSAASPKAERRESPFKRPRPPRLPPSAPAAPAAPVPPGLSGTDAFDQLMKGADLDLKGSHLEGCAVLVEAAAAQKDLRAKERAVIALSSQFGANDVPSARALFQAECVSRKPDPEDVAACEQGGRLLAAYAVAEKRVQAVKGRRGEAGQCGSKPPPCVGGTVVAGKCTCSAEKILAAGQCKPCPAGQVASAGKCVPKPPDCKGGKLVNGKCQCPANNALQAGECKPCPADQVLTAGKCAPKPPPCKGGKVAGGKCQCPAKTVLDGGACIKKLAAISIKAPSQRIVADGPKVTFAAILTPKDATVELAWDVRRNDLVALADEASQDREPSAEPRPTAAAPAGPARPDIIRPGPKNTAELTPGTDAGRRTVIVSDRKSGLAAPLGITIGLALLPCNEVEAVLVTPKSARTQIKSLAGENVGFHAEPKFAKTPGALRDCPFDFQWSVKSETPGIGSVSPEFGPITTFSPGAKAGNGDVIASEILGKVKKSGSAKIVVADCGVSELDRLQKEVDLICKGTGDRACPKTQAGGNLVPCAKLRENLSLFDACIAARQAVIDRCFDGKPDKGHRDAVKQEVDGRRRCFDRLKDHTKPPCP